MMSGHVIRMIVLVSCAHAMVHIYELSLPSVEQEIAAEYYENDIEAGKRLTGVMSNSWRLAWGLGAMVAGWLVDRYGGRRMLAIYLLGASGMCIAVASSQSVPWMFAVMLVMGGFASIYHPAGLALISHETTAENRPRALGIHGIFGSLGIGSAPLIAWITLSAWDGWRAYYWVLAIPGVLLGVYFGWLALRVRDERAAAASQNISKDDEEADWRAYFTLAALAMMQGFVYSAMLSFLPRYLSDTPLNGGNSDGKILAAGVLLIGCVGQYLAGWYARPKILELQLTLISFGNVPFLLWMSVATGWSRVVAAGLFALVHFMNQPVYNSLIAKYTPRSRRSLCYGFSFAAGLGLGSFGASFAGYTIRDFTLYGTLGVVAATAGMLGLELCRLDRARTTTL